MEKISNEEIIKFFDNNGYIFCDENNGDLSINEYYLVMQKDTGYKCKMSYLYLKMNKRPNIFGLKNEFHLENVVTFIKNKNTNIEVLSLKDIRKSNRNRILVELKCECGKEFRQTFDDIVKNKYVCCNECNKNRRGVSRRTYEKFFKILQENGFTILEKNNLKPKNTDRILVQNKDGYRGYMSLSNFSKGRKGNMTIFSTKTNRENYVYNLNNFCRINNIKTKAISLVDEPKFNRQNGVLFECKCGNKFITSGISFLSNKFYCDKCSFRHSRGEMLIAQLLEDNNINFISEFVINSCRDELPLPFDFYLTEYNKLIEIDGIQHFKPTQLGSITKEQSIKNFEVQVKHDKIKDEYCEKFNIPLLRVTYKEINDKSYIDKILNFIKE